VLELSVGLVQDVQEAPAARARILALDDNRLYTARVRFEWDPPKAEANLRTYGVSFAEAVTVLEDDFALTRDNADPAEESRFVTLGHKRQRMRYEEGRS
jgi:hypothetical protein